jgi:hypothetical protein
VVCPIVLVSGFQEVFDSLLGGLEIVRSGLWLVQSSRYIGFQLKTLNVCLSTKLV